MASRAQEKERRRQERLAAEKQAQEAAKRKQRMRVGAGVALGLVAIVAVVVAVIANGSKDSSSAEVPKQQTAKLSRAAAAAGCSVHTYKWSEANDRQHVAVGTKVDYKHNPPSYGPHYPVPASDGSYVGKPTPATGFLVHALEHGRIEIQYSPELSRKKIAQLESLFHEKAGSYGDGQYELLFKNGTRMPYQVAATAWGHDLTCPTFNPRIFDAIRAFRLAYTQKGPEHITVAE